MFHKIGTALQLLGAYCIRGCSYCIPRSSKIVVCIGWHHGKTREMFADNAKYFFLHLQHAHPDVTSVWLAKDRALATVLQHAGLRAHYLHSWKGIYYALRAGHTIVDAHLQTENWKFSGGSTLTQLWHGKGMKKSGHASKRTQHVPALVQPGRHTTYDTLIATSHKTAELLATTFTHPADAIAVTGHPRTDLFYKDIPGAAIDAHTTFAEAIQRAKANGAKKIVLYAPTFRPDGSNPLATFDVARANAYMAQHNYHLMVSLHPKFSARDSGISEHNSHLTYIAAGYDIYPQLTEVDILITDYSSLYVDFLLLDRPIIFYVYDFDWYAQEAGLYPDFNTLTPGPHPRSFDDLLLAITAADTYTEARKTVRETLFTHNDGNASHRITQLLNM